ncbi:hypothetical protein COOONC_21841 [Cooperia oncophora]
MSAIDFLQPERLVLSPIYGKERASRKTILSDDDESVYSHPSMINDSERIPERVILSSSPLNNGYPPQNVATGTIASGLTDLGTSVVSVNHTRMRPSETLDSGIDSENRDPNPETISSVSDDKGRELIDGNLNHPKPADSATGIEVSTNNFNGSGTDPPATNLLETLQPAEEISAIPLNEGIVKVVAPPEALEDLNNDVFDDDDVHTAKAQNDGAVPIPQANVQGESIFGTSLHDELILADVKPGSNSLLSRSWKKPTTTSSEPERSGSALLSSSSGTEADGGIVSFDQALRSAMETTGSPDKELDLDDTRELGFETDVEDADDEHKSPSRKESAALSEQVTSKLTTIPREVGLDSQDFRCPMCRKSIGAAFSKYGVCAIDGLYYCADCMRAGGEMPVPARILRSWDWKPRTVSDRGRAFIEANQDNVLVHIDLHNPSLYDHVPLLKAMKVCFLIEISARN